MPRNPQEEPQLSTQEYLARALDRITFPASRHSIELEARRSRASDAVLAALDSLPDRNFQNRMDVMNELEIIFGDAGESLSRTYDDPYGHSMGQSSASRTERAEEDREGRGQPGLDRHAGSAPQG